MIKFYYIAIFIVLLTICDNNFATARFGSFDETPEKLRTQGLKYYYAGNYNSAFDCFGRAIDKLKKRYGEKSIYLADYYFELGQLELNQSKFNKAEYNLTQATIVNPNSITYKLELAKLLSLRNKDQASYEQIKKSLDKNKNSIPANASLLRFISSQGMHATSSQAAKVYNHLLEKSKDENLLISTLIPNHNISHPEIAKPSISETQNKDKDLKEEMVKTKKVNTPKEDVKKSKKEIPIEKAKATNKSSDYKQITKKPKQEKNKTIKTKHVPPPPSTLVVVPPAPSTQPYPTTNITSGQIKLNAKAIIKNQKSETPKTTDTATKQTSTKPPKSNDSDSKSGVDSDFMLDWGSVKK